MTGARERDGFRIGLIDIGSNSVRMVAYDAPKRVPLPVYNEKAMCQLGRDLSTTGRLYAEGKGLAHAALARYALLAKAMRLHALHVLATAAMRDAADGREFLAEIEERHGLKVQLISGEQEAHFAALGILASMHAPAGIVGDLGGGSLELVRLGENGIGEQTTLPLGLFRVLSAGKGDVKSMRKHAAKILVQETWLADAKVPCLYAIGGSLRAMAKLHMTHIKYPLEVLHGYTVPAKNMLAFANSLLKLSAAQVAGLAGVSAKRSYEIQPACAVLASLLEVMDCEQVVFSASGIREGFLFERLDAAERSLDPLLAGCADLARLEKGSAAYAQELFAWMKPLFKKEEKPSSRLREAFCLLSEIGSRVHPEYRPAEAFHTILHSELAGLNHPERIALALSVYHRHRYKIKEHWPVLALASETDRSWARLVGTAANLAYHIAGGIAGALSETLLNIAAGRVELTLPKRLQALSGETLKKRIDGLGEAWTAFSKSER